MRKLFETSVISVVAFGLAGCSSLPGSDRQQGAVIGGASGAAVGAAVTENRALGAIIGGALGAAGGYVIGANKDKIIGEDSENEVAEASREAETTPATPQEAKAATTADVNLDGFVTLDEVVALERANLNDDEIVDRLRSTGQVFELTEEQKRYLLDKGVSQSVVDRLDDLNRTAKDELPDDSVIGQDPETTI